jgi:TPP-dependent trihydroxycyclohexane-1,2-dione (THcHDO) dehydratase
MRREILDDNIDRCAAATVAELKGLAAMELVPSTVLKEEYVALQTTIYEQYQGELAPDPAHETSLVDVLAGFLVNNRDTIVAEIIEGVISPGTRSSLINQFATSSQRGPHHNMTNLSLNGPTMDKDRNNALTVMSSAQAYLERMCCILFHWSWSPHA